MGKEQLFQCPVCGLHYKNAAVAEQCEAFCSAHHACSVEIMEQSIEHQQLLANRRQKAGL